MCRFLDAGDEGLYARRQPASKKRQGRKSRSDRGEVAGRAYGDFAGGSGVRMVFAVGDATDFAVRGGCELRGDRPMRGLRGAIMVTLGMVARTSGVLRQAPALSAACQPRRRA